MSTRNHAPYQRLKGKLTEKGKTYADIANLLNISSTAVSHKINGRSDFLMSQALIVEKEIGLDIKNFIR